MINEEEMMYFEVRPRLGSINAYIPKIAKGNKTVQVSNEGNLISIIDKDSDVILKTYSWPSKTYGRLCSKSVHGLFHHKEELTVRFQLKNSALSMISLKHSKLVYHYFQVYRDTK